MKKLLTSIVFLPLFFFVASPTFASSFSDSFTDSNGTTLHDHNNIWDCENNAEGTIQSNKAVKTSVSGAQICVSNEFENGSASSVVNFPNFNNDNSSAVYLRYLDANNYYQCNVNATDGYVIFKMYQGNFSILQLVSASPGTGNHTILCTASGSTITLTVDGTQRAQVVDTDLPNAGRGGILLHGEVTVDDYNSIDADAPSAEIIVNPKNGNKMVGSPFNVDVQVEATNSATFNAARSTVAVSSNLSITGIHAPTSNACNLQYTQTPTTSNASFAGAIFGDSSDGCIVYTMTLTPTATGTGTITFTNASVKSYEDNSEILTDVENGSFTLTDGPTPTPTPLLEFQITNVLQTYKTNFDLTGTKLSTITKIFVNGSDTNSTYPTSTSWENAVTLTLGANNFTLYGADDEENQTATQTVTVNRHTLGDINGDEVVDLIDASLFAVDWDKTENLTYNLSDMNDDGVVDLTDLSILAKLIE